MHSDMALTATVHVLDLTISDLDRGTYESLELRVARHPSESERYLFTRILAYALEYADGIAFSKGGLSSDDEPTLSVRDATGLLRTWIEIGTPSAERLHKASKAAERVALYTHHELTSLRREARSRTIHRLEHIEVWRFAPSFLDQLAQHLERRSALEVVRNEERIYVTLAGALHEAELSAESLLDA